MEIQRNRYVYYIEDHVDRDDFANAEYHMRFRLASFVIDSRGNIRKRKSGRNYS